MVAKFSEEVKKTRFSKTEKQENSWRTDHAHIPFCEGMCVYPGTLFGARELQQRNGNESGLGGRGGEQHQDQNFCEQKHRLKKTIKLLMLTSSIPLGCQDHLSNLLIKRRTVKLVVKFFPSRISILHLSLYWFPKHFLAYNVLLYTLLGVLPGPLASLSPPLVLSLRSTVADPDL